MTRESASMTRDDLIEAIEVEHGVATDEGATDDELRAQLTALDAAQAEAKSTKRTGKKGGRSAAQKEPADEPAPAAAEDATPAKPKTVRIKIFGDKQNNGDVVVTYEGKNFQIKRNVEVDVPYCVFTTLNDAVITDFAWEEKTGALIPSDRQRYPFVVIPT